MKLHKGDTVKIIKGKDSGKTGKIIRVLFSKGGSASGGSDKNKIVVEGLNVFKKHARPKKQGEKGEVVRVSRPLHASNAMIICGSCKKPTRIGVKIEEKNKFRICKKCKAKL